ncbi:hypothetical protein H7F51_11365 [Novosphingobium flavum]|uniref:Uncharacterized protein n=1 Tax=Novosphingobium flavum TaxID=1778672 RepID=A0A7X1KM00_9SPHN|nr:hypothetical protein [Novosphingobium flavum]MBC2666116.1 hypothetical protein [Novosphingobium flavum]
MRTKLFAALLVSASTAAIQPATAQDAKAASDILVTGSRVIINSEARMR